MKREVDDVGIICVKIYDELALEARSQSGEERGGKSRIEEDRGGRAEWRKKEHRKRKET